MIVYNSPVRHPFHERKIVLMSGLSDPQSCQLSEAQTLFLQKLGLPPEELVFSNFPYLTCRPQFAPRVGLFTASLRNGKQFLGARNVRYQQAAIAHWSALVESCSQLVVITLSCGLEILNSCLTSQRSPKQLTVIALGPVARSRPVVPHLLVRGRKDFVSLPFFQNVDILLPDVGHMNYLESEIVLDLVRCHCRSRYD